MIKNISRWSLPIVLLVIGLLAASHIQAQDSTSIATDTVVAPAAAQPTAATPATTPAVESENKCTEANAPIPADPTPTLTGAARSQTFNNALQVSGLSLATILAVMAIFGGLTAMLTRFIPAEQE